MATAMEVGGALPLAMVEAPGSQYGQKPQTAEASVEKMNQAVAQELNLESARTRASGLLSVISRILEGFDALTRSNSSPRWKDALGQLLMVNLEVFNIVEEIKKVSVAFDVHPQNLNIENAMILPVMLSSKLLSEMEVEDNIRREQLTLRMQKLPVSNYPCRLKY